VRLSFALTATLSFVLVASCRSASALNPELDISQYAHRAWKVSDGFTPGTILAIAQTPDGYLWLGTEFGLYRFDGLHAVSWRPPDGQDLPSLPVHSLLAARDGTLWIGTDKGIASWKEGNFKLFPELEGQVIHSLLQDREGTIWSSGEKLFSAANICAIGNGGVRCYGEDGSLGEGWIASLFEDKKGELWAIGKGGIWRWRPGPAKFYPLPFGPDYLDGIAEDDTGKLLIGIGGGIRRFFDGKSEAYPLPSKVQPFTTRTLLRDHDGGVWIAAYHAGLVHVHDGRTDVFTQADGLSSDEVVALFEDRENNLWVSTNNGLDRFRDTAVVTFSPKEGLSNGLARSVLADKDGSVWIATPSGLDRWRKGQIFPFDNRDGKLNGLSPTSLFQDRSGRIWVSTTHELGYLESNRFVSVTRTYDGRMLDFAQDSAGGLWIADQQGGLLHLSGSRFVERIPWGHLGHKDFALSLAADHLRGGLWLGFYGGGISYFADGHIQKTYTVTDGLGHGTVTVLQVEKNGTLWAATDGGVSRMKDGRFVTLTRENGLPCNPIHWMMEDDDRSLWLDTPCGLARLASSEIDSWTAAAYGNQAAKQTLHPTVFEGTDGVRMHEISYHAYNPPVTKSLDGKIWFVPEYGVSVIDPHRLPFNKLAPPVHIEKIIADAISYDATNGLRLPPLVRALTINYIALSLAVPEKVRFRYRLVGQDSDWTEVANERQVQYTNLAPGHYTFRVVACNNDGVWNEAGAFLTFSIAPAYYQTTSFRVFCAVASLLLLWAAYQYRVNQLERQFTVGLEARVSERTRIARELHDTLLQALHGLMFQFQAVRNLMPRRPEEAMQSLDEAIGDTKKALAESRDAIQGLRSEPLTVGDLAELLKATSQELAHAEHESRELPKFDLIEEGERRNLSSTIREEVCRIAVELLRNAYQHAHAHRIETEIRFANETLRLRIRDDGGGIDPEVLKEGGRPGHWGLRGIRERAERIGAHVDFWSEVGAGTEVQIEVPGSTAYETSPDGVWLRLLRKVRNRAER
jgi:ligand-binding sensor domain-containing protein/signal transduction histidine kinase